MDGLKWNQLALWKQIRIRKLHRVSPRSTQFFDVKNSSGNAVLCSISKWSSVFPSSNIIDWLIDWLNLFKSRFMIFAQKINALQWNFRKSAGDLEYFVALKWNPATIEEFSRLIRIINHTRVSGEIESDRSRYNLSARLWSLQFSIIQFLVRMLTGTAVVARPTTAGQSVNVGVLGKSVPPHRNVLRRGRAPVRGGPVGLASRVGLCVVDRGVSYGNIEARRLLVRITTSPNKIRVIIAAKFEGITAQKQSAKFEMRRSGRRHQFRQHVGN